MDRGAVISDCGRYRYRLHRIWDRSKPAVAWIMLNPSTADAETDDPTIRRCMTFSEAWGYGGIRVVNLFAYRATDPRELKQIGYYDLVGGPENKGYLIEASLSSALIVAAWGAHGKLWSRGDTVRSILGRNGLPLHALKLTKAGAPCHPLYLKRNLKPFLWDDPHVHTD